MSIDVADVFGAELRISKRQTHRLRHLVGLGTGNVRAVGVGAETQNFGINLGAARFGEFKFFENQGAATLADHQTVALGIEGTRRQLRMVVVVSACSKKRIENGGVGSVKLFAAACDHGFGAACENRFVGVSDGLRGRGAGRTRRDDAALDLEEHADVDRCRVRHHAHVSVGVHVGCGALQNEACDVGDGRGRTRTRTVGDAEISRTQKRLIVQKSRICQCHFRGVNAQKSYAAHAAGAFAVVLARIECKGGGGAPQARM